MVSVKPEAGQPRSSRGRSRANVVGMTPLEQIRKIPGYSGVDHTGAWAYYLRPEGATIRDALILYPNGGVPEMDDDRMRARYGTNAEYYRSRQAQKGFEFIGPSLTEHGVRRLVEILAANRDDEILFVEDEIANCADTIANADRPEIRDQARKRLRLFEQRLDTLRAPFDPDALLGELKEIARAQQLAAVPPAVLRVMKSMIGDVNDRMVEAFQNTRSMGEGGPTRRSRSGADASVFDREGGSQ